jgi:hypothetical protein
VGLVALSGVLAVGGATLHASRSEPFTLAPPVPGVEDRVAALEQTVDALTRKVNALEARLAREPMRPARLWSSPPRPNDLPRGSQPLEFNGTTFYIVPLDARPEK